MISGVSAYSSAYSTYAASSARRAQEAGQSFSVPASALRTPAAAEAVRDPVADSVRLSRDFPQLFAANPTYAPPPAVPVSVQRIQEGVGAVREASASASDAAARATPGLGQELEDQASGNAGIPGMPGEAGGAEGSGGSGGADPSEEENQPGEPDGADGQDMSNEEQAQVRELSNRDREVRAHEQAHQAVGGAYAGGASYEYQQGPDGQRYAVGGEVSIDMSSEREPEATIAKMQQVKAAAMAPAEPSGQDRSVAASATSNEMQARAELAAANAAGGAGGGGGEGGEGEGEGSGSVGGAGGASGAESAGALSMQRQSRGNPYQGVSSAANVIDLPNAYRAIDIVA